MSWTRRNENNYENYEQDFCEHNRSGHQDWLLLMKEKFTSYDIRDRTKSNSNQKLDWKEKERRSPIVKIVNSVNQNSKDDQQQRDNQSGNNKLKLCPDSADDEATTKTTTQSR